MVSCEHCMLLEDLVDFSSKNNYLVALGFIFDSIPRVEEVVIVPESKLKRYRKGDYEWQVIEAEQLPPNLSRSDMQGALKRMCSKYGHVQHVSNTINLGHEERTSISNELARQLIQRPYVHSVFLTGSTALGQDRSDSDIDILVVLGYCPGNRVHGEIDELVKAFYPAELFYIQQKDFLIAQNLQYPLIRDRSLIASR